MSEFEFRWATAADGASLLRVQRRSIHTIDRSFYALRELESWAAGLTADGYARCIADGEAMDVAIDASERIAGFSSWKDDAILGLFVDPTAQGRGLGTALLRRAEAALIASGAHSIRVRASLSGVNFYERQGYASPRYVDALTRGGLEVRFVDLEKMLKE